METRDHLMSQRQTFKRIQTRFNDISNRFPAVNSLVQRVNLRKRRDSIILGLVIGFCTFLMLLYTFHWTFSNQSNFKHFFLRKRAMDAILQCDKLVIDAVVVWRFQFKFRFDRKKYKIDVYCGVENARLQDENAEFDCTDFLLSVDITWIK